MKLADKNIHARVSYRSLNFDYDVRVHNMFYVLFYHIIIAQYGKLTSKCSPSQKQTSLKHCTPHQNCGSLI